MTATDLPHVLRAEQVAELLDLGRNTIYELVKRNAIPGVLPLPGRSLRFSTATLLAWLESPSTAAGPADPLGVC